MAKSEANPTPTRRIVVTGPDQGRYRGGYGTVRKFTAQPQEFTDLDLTEDELGELMGDPELKVAISDIAATPAT
jgi:hypothetical protein